MEASKKIKKGNIALKEHQINGTRHTANITGTFNFDWNEYSQFVLTPTGAVTLGNVNLPTGDNTKVMSGVFKASSHAVTFPANWVAREGNSALSATKDTFFTAETMPNGEVSYFLDNGEGSGTGSSAGTIENQIVDGVTTRAPSQNAVFDALAGKQNSSTAFASFGQLGGSDDIQTVRSAATRSGYWRISLNETSGHPTGMPTGFVYTTSSNVYTYLELLYTGAESTGRMTITDWDGNMYIQYRGFGWKKITATPA